MQFDQFWYEHTAYNYTSRQMYVYFLEYTRYIGKSRNFASWSWLNSVDQWKNKALYTLHHTKGWSAGPIDYLSINHKSKKRRCFLLTWKVFLNSGALGGGSHFSPFLFKVSFGSSASSPWLEQQKAIVTDIAAGRIPPAYALALDSIISLLVQQLIAKRYISRWNHICARTKKNMNFDYLSPMCHGV